MNDIRPDRTIVGHAPRIWRRTVRGQPVQVRPGRTLDLAVHRGTPAMFQGPPTTVFMLHGAGGNKDQWRETWRALIGTGHTLVAFDMMGHGESPRPRGQAPYAGDELIADALAVFERHRSERNVLIGHSYGGALVLALLERLQAAQRLGEVAAAVLLGARLFRGDHPIRDVPLAELRRNRARLEAEFRALAWHPEVDPALLMHEEALARRNSLAVYQSLFVAPRWMDPAAAPRLTIPVLVLAGDSDRIVTPDDARTLATALPQARLEIVARCGHQLMLERPAEVNALITEFLRGR